LTSRIISLVVVLTLTTHAAAQGDARDEARGHYEAGIAHVERAEWREAHAEFVRAQELFASPHNVYNIGQCERALGRYVAARATFVRFLAIADGSQYDTLRESARGYLVELASRVAHLRVTVRPARAEVAVDGKPAAGELELDPGRHTVRVARKGYRTRFVDKDLAPGERAEVVVRLDRLAATLAVDADIPGAVVALEGRAVGVVPWTDERPAGSYRVEIRAPGYELYESDLSVAPGGRADLDAVLVPERPSVITHWWFWAAIGGALGSAAVTTWVVTRPEPEPEPYQGGSLGWVITHGFALP
jgi:hypothetical protein